MFRRLIITALATSAISLATLGWLGYLFPIYRAYHITGQLHCYVYFADGLARFYGIHASEAIVLDPTAGATRMTVRRASDGAICQRYSHALPQNIAPYDLFSTRWNPRPPRPAITLHLFGARTWIWLPVMLLITYPIVALTRDRIAFYLARHRRKRNQCVNCGYNLTGLIDPRCPECGTPTSVLPHQNRPFAP